MCMLFGCELSLVGQTAYVISLRDVTEDYGDCLQLWLD